MYLVSCSGCRFYPRIRAILQSVQSVILTKKTNFDFHRFPFSPLLLPRYASLKCKSSEANRAYRKISEKASGCEGEWVFYPTHSKFSPLASVSKIYFIWMQRRGKRLVENFILIGWLFGMRQQLLKQVQHDWRIEHQGCFFQNTFFSKEAFIEPVIPNLFRNLPKRVEKGLDVSAFHSNS